MRVQVQRLESKATKTSWQEQLEMSRYQTGEQVSNRWAGIKLVSRCQTGEQVGGGGQVMGMAGAELLQSRREWLDVGVRWRQQVGKSEGIWWTGRETATNQPPKTPTSFYQPAIKWLTGVIFFWPRWRGPGSFSLPAGRCCCVLAALGAFEPAECGTSEAGTQRGASQIGPDPAWTHRQRPHQQDRLKNINTTKK